ncbi:hypothetical protein PILCRDRAFT_508020 [Piloderma croceum F 1598]|uniref:Uncharacterized protein n=1 Tax=Piloderma croceum (strain F 1598) TaxID=765440 RepID=A0A0C3BVD8_PILCF|nr:hypothetical protein PILCRDRAFT_508020 [Piloderma croceum F 1598]
MYRKQGLLLAPSLRKSAMMRGGSGEGTVGIVSTVLHIPTGRSSLPSTRGDIGVCQISRSASFSSVKNSASSP